MLTKIISSSEEKICKHNIMLSYRIDLYFHDYKLAREIDKNGHSDKNIVYEIERQKAIEQKLGCKFVRIDADKEDLFRAIHEIFRRTKKSIKKL